MPSLRRVPWWAGVFTLALGMRLGFLFLADEPLTYSHPYNYFNGGLSIVEHGHPWSFVLRSDAWHRWLGPWTIAPLYYLFVALVFGLLGPHLLPLQLLQCGLDSLSAVMVGILAREVCPRRGAWAGVAYALNFRAIELACTTLTENVHTPLLLGGLTLLVLEASGVRSARRVVAGGFLLGLSGLARSVSTAFVPLAALWRLRQGKGKADLRAVALIALAGAAAVLPWTIRNVVVIGDWVPVESISVYNLWDDNAFVEGDRRRHQEETIGREPTLAAQRAQALRYTWRGIRRHPEAFAEKAWENLLHFVRPDGLHLLLKVEHAQPPWRHAALILFDDAILVPTVLLLVVFLAAGAPSPARSLIALWTAYYLLMVVVLFHNEIRYRATLMPFALAGAAGGWAVLSDRARRRGLGARLAVAVGLVSATTMIGPYAPLAWRALVSTRILRDAEPAVRRGDLATADLVAARAAGQDPEAARPWLLYGRALAHAGHPAAAIEAYSRARDRKAHVWIPLLVLPRLLEEAGRGDEARAALREADEFSWHVDAWLGLEAAWSELPPPSTDVILLARGDYGAARGFYAPMGDHRWSRHRAFLRLVPTVPSAAYDVTLEMGSPEPSPLAAPTVSARVEGGAGARFTLGRAVAPYTLRTPAPSGGVLVVRLETPTWNRLGEPAEQGVRVDRMIVAPVR